MTESHQHMPDVTDPHTNVRARVIKAAEIGRFIGLDSMSELIRKLYLPRNVPRWQQLVRVAVLVVGNMEQCVGVHLAIFSSC